MERLTKRSENGTAIYNTPSGDPIKWENNRCKVLQKLAEYEDLEEQGKLAKFPCAVGDKLYEPRHDRGMVTEYIVTNISYFGNNSEIFISWKLNSGIYSNFSGVHASKIGKTVFITQEEAEAALAEVENETDFI